MKNKIKNTFLSLSLFTLLGTQSIFSAGLIRKKATGTALFLATRCVLPTARHTRKLMPQALLTYTQLSAFSNSVDTYGWDTAFAIGYSDANAAITQDWPNVPDSAKNFKAHGKDEDLGATYSLEGNWQPWQLTTGGDGKNVRLHCPIENGSYVVNRTNHNIDRAIVEIELRLDQVPDPSASTSDKTKYRLKVSTDSSQGEPKVIVRGLTNVGTDLYDPDPNHNNHNKHEIIYSELKALLSDWFNDNLGEFNHVFHSLDISERVDENDQWKWIKPTSTSYAVTDTGSMTDSVFGVLTMTGKRSKPASHQVSPFAIPNGANSGFNIAGPRFVQQMLLPGAQAIFRHASVHDFDIEDDNSTITNKSTLTWDNFHVDKIAGFIGPGTVTLTIDPKRFKLRVIHDKIELEFTNLNYNYLLPGLNVHVNYREYYSVNLKDAGNGKKVFWLQKERDDNAGCQVSVTKSTGLLVGEILTGIATSVAGGIVGGALGESLAEGASIAGEGAAEGSIELTGYAIWDAIEEGGGDEYVMLDAAPEAAEELGDTTFTSSLNGSFLRNHAKLIGSGIGMGVGGATIGTTAGFLELMANKQFSQLPSFDDFAQQCIQSHNWPGQIGYQLQSAALHSSFQLGGRIIW